MKSDESTTVMFVNGTLKKVRTRPSFPDFDLTYCDVHRDGKIWLQLTDEESEQKTKSSEYSPVFKILVPDLLYHVMDYDGTSHLSSKTIAFNFY